MRSEVVQRGSTRPAALSNPSTNGLSRARLSPVSPISLTNPFAHAGTPLQNSVVDIYSLFAFLGKKIVNPLHEYPEFKAKIEQPLKNKRAKIAMARLTVRPLALPPAALETDAPSSQVVLKAIMLRRKMTSDLLPPMEINDVTGGFIYPCVFVRLAEGWLLTSDCRDEQKFYESVEDLMKQKLSDMQEAGNVRSNYTNVLGLILVRLFSPPPDSPR